MVIGSLAAGGTLGILIPPSISLILYGVLVEESIGRLYMAGFIPGLLLSVSFMVMIAVLALLWRGMAPKEQGDSFATWVGWKIRLLGLIQLLPVLALVFLVLGVIYLNIAAPSEAAAFGVTGAFVLAILLNSGDLIRPFAGRFLKSTGLIRIFTPSARETLLLAPMPDRQTVSAVFDRNFGMVRDSIISAVRTTGMIFLIVLAALTLSFAFARLGLSQQIAQVITDLNLNDWQLVLALVIFYLVLGTFMESFAMMVTTVPILLPALKAAGRRSGLVRRDHGHLSRSSPHQPPRGHQPLRPPRRAPGRGQEQAEETGQVARESTIKDVWIGVLPFMAAWPSLQSWCSPSRR